jgi:hypothetical protein
MRPEGEAGPVQRVSERIARRELLRRGGLAAGGAVATWLLATSEARAVSPACGNVGCRCDGAGCPSCPHLRTRRNGGPYWDGCWAERGGRCCDYWCNHQKCRCCNWW